MTGIAEHGGGRHQAEGEQRPRVTTIRKALIIGAATALLVSGASSLATARLADRQSELDEQRAEIAQLASQVAQQEAQIVQLEDLLGEGPVEVAALNSEIADLRQQLEVVQADKATLEEQLSMFMNPDPGPTPTLDIEVNWMQWAVESIPWSGLKGWALVKVTIENTSDEDVDFYYSGSQFIARDDQQFVYPAAFPTGYFSCGAISDGRTKFLQPALSGGGLRPGEKVTGDMAFDIPAGTVLTELVWNTGLPGVDERVLALPSLLVGSETCR
jgi:cell division protein FtsB